MHFRQVLAPISAACAVLVTATPARTASPPPAAADSLVEVIPDRLEGSRGLLRCLAFAAPSGFPSRIGRALARSEASVASSRPRCTFRDLPPGPIAISVVHDADVSGDITTNALGIPVEGYGFSRDARGTFGPPDFEDAAFTHDGRARTLKVRLSY
jgi:uncharacterized protein (DUF2141 family)